MADDKAIEVTMGDNQAELHFANMVVVSYTPHNFCLDFVQIAPIGFSEMGGRVVTRIALPPAVAVRLEKALQEQTAKYEDQFGCIPNHSILAGEGDGT